MISLRRSALERNVSPSPPDWRIAFGNDHALEVDLGCGRGNYAWNRAVKYPHLNIVALDTRGKWLLILRDRCRVQAVNNLRAIRCDVTEDLPLLFAPDSISGFTIHHPDPWWKKRHRKRRVVRPELVAQLTRLLIPGAWVYAQTDVPDLASEMRATFDACGDLEAVDAQSLLTEHMGGLRSHREGKCLQKGLPILRMAYVRKGKGPKQA